MDSAQEWVELEHISSGDHLLTPSGVVTVAEVTTHEQAETLVWELDTAGPDTFTVHTSSVDLLVHNANSCGPRGADGSPTGNWTDAQRSELLAGENLAGLDPVNPQVLTDALAGFRRGEFTGPGGNRYLLDADQMSDILSKHHPRYWRAGGTSSTRTVSTGFRGSITPSEMIDMVDDIIRTGTRDIRVDGAMITKTIGDIEYEVFLDNATGRVTHFTPLDPG